MTVNTISLKDTGYGNITNTGTRFSTVANSGNEVTLLVTSVEYGLKPNVSSQGNPGSSSVPEGSKGSVEAPVLTVRGSVKRTVSADMTTLSNIKDMVTSDGVKLLYYNSTTDGYRDITDTLGETDATHNQSSPDLDNGEIALTIKHFHGWLSNFSVTQFSSGDVLTWSFDFITTS